MFQTSERLGEKLNSSKLHVSISKFSNYCAYEYISYNKNKSNISKA